jgi:hypothetical protein
VPQTVIRTGLVLELEALSKDHTDATKKAALFPMTREEAATFDKRAKRIGELWVLLRNCGE